MPSVDGLTTGQRVRKLRKARGWSMDEFARQAQVSRNQIAEFETGQTHELRGDTLRKYSQALSVPEQYILTGEGPTTLAEAKGLRNYPSDGNFGLLPSEVEQHFEAISALVHGRPAEQEKLQALRVAVTRRTALGYLEGARNGALHLAREATAVLDAEDLTTTNMAHLLKLSEKVRIVFDYTRIAANIPASEILPRPSDAEIFAWLAELTRDERLEDDPLTADELARGLHDGSLAAEPPELDDEADTD